MRPHRKKILETLVVSVTSPKWCNGQTSGTKSIIPRTKAFTNCPSFYTGVAIEVILLYGLRSKFIGDATQLCNNICLAHEATALFTNFIG